MAGLFSKKSWQHEANHRHARGACHQLRVAIKNAATQERDTRAMATSDCKLFATATKVGAILDVEREAKIARDAETYAFSASAT